MARQSPRQKLNPLGIQFYERYVRFTEHLHNAWMQYEIQAEILKIVEQKCEDGEYRGQIRVQSTSPINSEKRAPIRLRGENIPGFIKRSSQKEIPEAVFLTSIALFEAFISDTAKIAYTSAPKTFLLRKIKGEEKDQVSEQENNKLLRMLIESANKEEVIERYTEEKLRGIFYGNPVDVFKKNKLGFDLDKTTGKNCEQELTLYAEIVARRNVLVHNLGRIDQKYIREVDGTTFNPGDKVTIERNYLFQSLAVLNDLAKSYISQVAVRVARQPLPLARVGITTSKRAS